MNITALFSAAFNSYPHSFNFINDWLRILSVHVRKGIFVKFTISEHKRNASANAWNQYNQAHTPLPL
jgi:hypothetical protein